jgi:hypothetical protein
MNERLEILIDERMVEEDRQAGQEAALAAVSVTEIKVSFQEKLLVKRVSR